MNIASVRLLGLIVIGAVAYWASVVVAMHFVEPEFNPVRVPMSAYVRGDHGAWMTTTYFVWSTALLGAGCGLVRTLTRTRLTKAAFSIFLLAAAAVFVAGLFPMDFPPPVRTLSGRLHATGGLFAFPTMALGALLFSLSFRHDASWRKLSVPALALSAGALAVFVLAICSLLVLGFAGYAQRVFFALLIAWMIMVGLHLTRFVPDEPRGPR